MSKKKLNSFQDDLISQYENLICKAISEHEDDPQKNHLIGKLDAKLKVICKAAQFDGLSEHVSTQLIQDVKNRTKAA